MRFIHTADWHLGKRLHDFSLIGEQREALARIGDLVVEARPDALILAGDVFDTHVPQVAALELWEVTVERIVGELGVPMVVIPGNHDHAERISLHAGLAKRAGLHIVHTLAASAEPVRIADVDLFGVPFHKPVHVNAAFRDASPGLDAFDYAGAMGWVLGRVREARSPGVPAVLVGHAFVEGTEEPEGEDAIQVGGAGGVPVSAFEGFAYVALGHIHGARKLGSSGEVRYSGSPYPYSFSEAGAEKSVTLVELAEDGRCTSCEQVPIEVHREVRVIDGLSFGEVVDGARALDEAERGHYTLVKVTDRDPIPHALARLREWYPNALLEQPAIEVRSRAPKLEGDYKTLRVEDAFRQFYRHVFEQDMGELEEALLVEALDEPEGAEA